MRTEIDIFCDEIEEYTAEEVKDKIQEIVEYNPSDSDRACAYGDMLYQIYRFLGDKNKELAELARVEADKMYDLAEDIVRGDREEAMYESQVRSQYYGSVL